MLEREVFLPLAPQPLWDDMTSAEGLDDWLGLEVEWSLEPGRPASFREPDGETREGVVDEVEPGRRLRFRWWPVDHRDDAASEVTWTLEPDGTGTRLTVIERPADAPPSTVATASAHAGSLRLTPPTWDRIDDRLFRAWARAHGPLALALR